MPDPADLVRAAEAHRMEGLLHRAATAAGAAAALGPAGPGLARLAAVRRMEAVTVLPHALRLATGPLVERGLEPLVFKGPALAARYPGPGLRPMVDIDLIVASDRRLEAVGALQDSGWAVVRPAGRDHHDTVLAHREVPTLSVEIHHDLANWRERANRLRGDTLWSMRRPAEILGLPLFGLPPEEEVVALAAHAGKPFHCFGRLIWVADLVVASAADPAIDWERVGRRAAEWGCRTVVAVALGQAARAGLDTPTTLREVPGPAARRRALAPLTASDWPETALTGAVPEYRLRFALADGYASPARLLAGAAAGQPPAQWPGIVADGLARAAVHIGGAWGKPGTGRRRGAPGAEDT